MIVYNNQEPTAVNNVGQFGATEGSIGAYKQAAEYAADSKYWALLAESKFGTVDDLIAQVELLYKQGALLKEDIEDLKQDFIAQDARLMQLISEANAAASDANNAADVANQKIVEIQRQLDILLNMTVTTTTLPAGSQATGAFDPTTGEFSFGIPQGQDGSVTDLGSVATGIPVVGDLGFYVDKTTNSVYKTALEDIANLIPSVRSISLNGGPADSGEVALTVNKATVGLSDVKNVASYSETEINNKLDGFTKLYKTKTEADADVVNRLVGEDVLVCNGASYDFYTVAANKTLTLVSTEGKVLTVNSKEPDSTGNIDILIPTGNPSLYLGEITRFPLGSGSTVTYPGLVQTNGSLIEKATYPDLGEALVQGNVSVVSETAWQAGEKDSFSWGKLSDGITDADSTNYINIRVPLIEDTDSMRSYVVASRDAAVVGVSTVDGVAGAVDLTGKYLQKTDAADTYLTKTDGATKTFVTDAIGPLMSGALFKDDPFVANDVPFRSEGANGVESVDMIKVTPENAIKIGSYASSVQGVEIHSAGRVQVVDQNDGGVETKYPIYSKRFRPEIEDLPFAAIGSYVKDSKGRTIGVTRTGINSDIKQLTQKVTFTQPVTIPDAVGDYDAVTLKQLRNNEGVSKSTTINFKTVSDLVTGTLPSGETIALTEGMVVETAANEHGIKASSKWRISATKDNSTYVITLVNGLFANLILHRSMGYEEFGFGGTDPTNNSAAIDEANRVARANSVIKKLSFPSGTFSTNQVSLDVDRRGFTFSGAGNDATILMSAVSGISLHHVGIDPRNRNRDRFHWHQTIEGFTINGNISNNGSAAATRAIYTAPYATIKHKSIDHRISNYDLLHLVLYWYGHSQGATNGATSTKYGVRVRNNSIKLMGYIGGSATGQCTVSIEGMSTTLISAANVDDTTVTVADATGFDTWFEIAFTNSTGGVETRRITAISGNVLTLDRAMTSAFPSGAKVEVPIIGTSLISSTIETGEIRIGDSQATYLAGNYSEEAKIYITKYVRALTITGMSTAEASPAISINVDKRSSIQIEGNDTTFSVAVNITDRSGAVGDRIDLYNAPKLDIRMNTRVQNPITLNGVYGFSSLQIEKTFDTTVQDNRFTSMIFSGFNHVSPAGSSTAEVIKFFQDAAQFGFDGYTFDLDITCRIDGNSSAVTPGILKRYGTSSAALVAQNSAPVSLFAGFNASTGYDVFIGASGNRGTVQIRSNPTSTVKSAISGTVTSVL